MKILTFSSLFPNRAQPHHGVFVENRLRHLVAEGGVEARVIAPVPWFPFTAGRFGAYGAFAKAPREDRRFGIEVRYPRYPVIPKVGMSLAPTLMYRMVRPAVERLLLEGFDFDLIDAHYFYPDGVAAAMIAKRLGKPLTITARGTDINLIPRFALPRRQILWAGRQAAAMIAVCQALKDEMIALGLDGARIRVLRNGVDLEGFKPLNRTAERDRLGVSGPVILSAGHLIPRKGHDFVVRALAQIPEATLLIVGKGPEEAALKALVDELGLGARVRFVGGVPHEEMPRYYSAADLLVLASDREGWPNVLLESMACGTPVVASRIWGNPEVVTAPAAGLLFDRRDPDLIADAVSRLLGALPERAATRRYAEQFSWDDTSKGQVSLFRGVLEQDGPRVPPRLVPA
ncbi:MAG: glycosyltransferase family 4 protein [Pseudomonadota bacterium]